MNKDKLLKKKDRVVADLELYDACSEIFRLLRDNHIKGIQLKDLTANRKEIRSRTTFTDEDGEWEAWYTVATRGRGETVNRPFFLTVEEEQAFIKQYGNTYRQAIREYIFKENGKIVEVFGDKKQK